MIDLNNDGIPDGAEVKMTASWVKKPRSKGGTAYAGDLRGDLSAVGNQAADNAATAGMDMEGQARAGIMADREFQPVSMMTRDGQRMQGGADSVIQMMEPKTSPFRASTDSEVADAGGAYRNFMEQSNKNARIMTGGMSGGVAPSEAERMEYNRRTMGNLSVSPEVRKTATADMHAMMGENMGRERMATDERIQTILSGGKVEEAKVTAGAHRDVGLAQAGAEKYKAEQGLAGTRETVAGQERVAQTTAGATRDVGMAQADAERYKADQETMRAREQAKLALEQERVRRSNGAYQGEIVRDPSGYVGVWDDKTATYKWEKPPTSTPPTEITGPGGQTVKVGGSGSPVDLGKIPEYRTPTAGSTPPAKVNTGRFFSKAKGKYYTRDAQGNVIWE